MKKSIFAFIVCISVSAFSQKYEGLALTPPMGWNSWNTFQTNIDEKLVMDMADAMVTSGMKAAGYVYLVIDDGWMAAERDNAGNLVADPKKFPRGIKVVSDYVHSKGLKFGIYNAAGTKTCSGYPGSRGYEFQDARLFAAWEIDYLKYDWCNTEGINPREAYTTMSKAVRAAGRPVVFGISDAGNSQPWLWASNIAHLWRTTADISNCFDCLQNSTGRAAWGILKIVEKQAGLNNYAGPGHWNNPGMLEVGNGLSFEEDKAHLALWAMSAAPLLAGNDLRRMTKETLALLTNKELLSIDQDSLGVQGFKYREKDSLETWFKPLRNGDWAVCFFNRSSVKRKVDFQWRKETVNDPSSKKQFNPVRINYRLRDVFKRKFIGGTDKPLKAAINPHDVLVLRMGR